MRNVTKIILDAATPEELFGSIVDIPKEYAKLLNEVQPSNFSDAHEKIQAQKATKHLHALYAALPSPKQTVLNAPQKDTMTTRRHTYTIDGQLYSDSFYNVYKASYGEANEKDVELWITANFEDNDLTENYVDKLREIRTKVPEEYRYFYPELVEAFKVEGIFEEHVGFSVISEDKFYSLADVKDAYQEGIHGRDVAWIFKRMLVAIGNAHDLGIVHGGVSDHAFIIQPENHGLKLRNWQYSVKTGERLIAIDGDIEDFYPPHVFEKKPVDYKLDINMAGYVAENLLQEDAPVSLRKFFEGCQISSVPEAAYLLGEFDELLLRLYGAPKFHKFEMPKDFIRN